MRFTLFEASPLFARSDNNGRTDDADLGGLKRILLCLRQSFLDTSGIRPKIDWAQKGFLGTLCHHAEGGKSVPIRPNPRHPFSY
jgi:hypothetical protein